MFFKRSEPDFAAARHELAKMGPLLDAALDRFGRDIEKAAARIKRRRQRSASPARIPAARVQRPTTHRSTAIPWLRTGSPATVPNTAPKRPATSGVSADAEAEIERARDAIRRQVLDLKDRLSRTHGCLGDIRRTRRKAGSR
jgi:ribosome-associated translation inhibitor RaiA